MVSEMDERLKVYDDKMKKTYEHLENDYLGIRAGRANPHVLDKLRVDYYGTPTPIQQVGNVTIPEARMIQIAPWEKTLIKSIEKAILASDIGITPSNDGAVIRLVFPELTEEKAVGPIDVGPERPAFFHGKIRVSGQELRRHVLVFPAQNRTGAVK